MTDLKLPYLATAALSGALFGSGLYVAQMVDPLKVLRFLDFGAISSGGWDPSLAFVMGAALIVMFIAVRIGKARTAPLFDSTFHEPEYTRIDRRLVGGAALFGIGWGMAGICPGPAISLIAFLPDNLWIFLVAMFVGSYTGSFIVPSGHIRRLADAQ
ncbi:MAG: DUF6691 family protein [Devosia sp.]